MVPAWMLKARCVACAIPATSRTVLPVGPVVWAWTAVFTAPVFNPGARWPVCVTQVTSQPGRVAWRLTLVASMGRRPSGTSTAVLATASPGQTSGGGIQHWGVMPQAQPTERRRTMLLSLAATEMLYPVPVAGAAGVFRRALW
jgi:hypothetical protein